MKFLDVNAAQVVRDGGIEAMDALNGILDDVEPLLLAEHKRTLRLAAAHAMSGVLDHLVNPVLEAHPELDVPEETWGSSAVERARERLRRQPR